MTKFSAQQQSQLSQIGVFLRENREKQGKSLEDIAIRTYIRPQLLNGIESGDPDLLPEPIFVQGFIRRYAENLGLDGKDLATQFSVDSIPSTPRPARQLVPEDSPTTRLTRAPSRSDAAQPALTDASAANAAMFSAGGVSPLEDSLMSAKATPDQATSAGEVPLIVDDAALDMPSEAPAKSPDERAFEISDLSFSQTDDIQPDTSKPDAFEIDTAAGSDNELQRLSDEASASNPSLPAADLPTADLPTADLPTAEDSFATKVAEFDRQNLTPPAQPTTQPTTQPIVEEPVAEPVVEPAAAPVSNRSFDDGLPAALTTAPDASVTPTYVNPDLVGAEYDRPEGPNLKPFVIGGLVVVLLTAAVVALASLFGGDRTPAVADNPTPAEQASGELETVGQETLPPVPAEPASPPASTAPVYVEAKANAEAWVSVIADGTTVFEGTLQPGDTAVWEGEETINVYSGDAGALEVAQNGQSAAVMGERGQPEEKIFTLN